MTMDKNRPKAKLLAKHFGPVKVTKIISSTAYELAIPKTMKIHPVFHISLLTPYQDPNKYFSKRKAQPPAPIVTSSGDQEYEVEEILDKRTDRYGKIEYLIRWQGYSACDDSWEPISNLNCSKLIKEFENQSLVTAKLSKNNIHSRKK